MIGTIYLAGGCFWGLQKYLKLINGVVSEDLAVECCPLECFYPAEEYHQVYIDRNPEGYCHLRPELFEYARKANKNHENR